jgi:hypothetical protein
VVGLASPATRHVFWQYIETTEAVMEITYINITERKQDIVIDGKYFGTRNRIATRDDQWYVCVSHPLVDLSFGAYFDDDDDYETYFGQFVKVWNIAVEAETDKLRRAEADLIG